MKHLLRSSKRYLRNMDLTDMALLKLCLISFGALIGLCIPSRSRKCAALLAGLLFGGIYLPLMAKLFPTLWEDEDLED